MFVKKISVVSLSKGILGEEFVKHELDIGKKRLDDLGVETEFMPNSLKGIEYTADHPEKRAEDLIRAFSDDSDMILCAIGGDDTYRLLPYLFDNGELENAVKNAPKKKIFLGFSDSTFNHFMLGKLGLTTFYGQAFLPDVCDIGKEMLPYSAKYFEDLIKTGKISKITPSEIWYSSREDFSPEAVGTALKENPNEGFVLLQGSAVFSGKIFGGCVDSMYDMFDNTRYPDTVDLCRKYGLFPDAEFWKGRILLLETSEEHASPEKYKSFLMKLKEAGVLDAVSGIIAGKPENEVWYDEYQRILVETADDPDLPIVYNVNVGHAVPRCIVPFGVQACVDAEKQQIVFSC